MVFWTLVAIVVISAFATAARFGTEFSGGGAYGWHRGFDFGDALMGLFLGAIVSGVIGMIVMFATVGIFFDKHHVTDTAQTTSTLVNLGDNHSVHGEFHGGLFLSYGTIDGTRTINFVSRQNGYATLGQVNADEARVYEGAKDPTMTRYDYTAHNYWLMPFTMDYGTSYDFRVPAGTITNDFVIGNGGTTQDDSAGD